MKKVLKKIIMTATTLISILCVNFVSVSASTFTLQNNILSVCVDQGNGKIEMHTTGGDPNNLQDDNKRMLYGQGTNAEGIMVGGEWKYISEGKKTEVSYWQDTIKKDNCIISTYTYNGIKVTRNITLAKNPSSEWNDINSAKITYSLCNTTSSIQNVSFQLMLDVYVVDKDDAPYSIPGYGKFSSGLKVTKDNMPNTWYGYDKLDKPTEVVQGGIPNDCKPDTLEFTSWNKFSNSVWNQTITNQENGDSCVIMHWNNYSIAPGETKTITTYYGVGLAAEVKKNTKVPLYRYCKNNDSIHFYTTDYNELKEGGLDYALEAEMCKVYPEQVEGTVPLYRYCKDKTSIHTYTTDYSKYGSGKDGYDYEGVQCYVYPKNISNVHDLLPLYRYTRYDGITFFTTDYNELKTGALGYSFDGIECYVMK